MDKYRFASSETSRREEVNFDLERMRTSLNSGSVTVPNELSPEEITKWICSLAGQNGSESRLK